LNSRNRESSLSLSLSLYSSTESILSPAGNPPPPPPPPHPLSLRFLSTIASTSIVARVFLSAGWRKNVTPVAKCTRDRSIPAVFGGGARQSVGRQVADCNGATKKKTTKERRKCPGTRYRPGQIRSLGLFVMLHLNPTNGWPFKTPRCHSDASLGSPGNRSYRNLQAPLHRAPPSTPLPRPSAHLVLVSDIRILYFAPTTFVHR